MRRALVALGASTMLLAGCSAGPSRSFPFATISGTMPPVSGRLLTGGSFTPQQYRGKVVVVNFWNYDCGPCRHEQPLLEAEWRRLRPQGVVVVGVMYTGGGWPDRVSVALTYLDRYGVSYPTITDPRAKLATAFGIPGIPMTVIADPSGHLRFSKEGELTPGMLERAISRVRSR